MDNKPLWLWGKWMSGPGGKRDPRPRYIPTGKSSLYRFEATDQLLHSAVGLNKVVCSCTWQRSLPRETNTGATKEFQHLTRAEEFVFTRLQIGHTKATKSHILWRGPLVTIVVKPWAMAICSWSVQCYRNVVRSTAQLTRWNSLLCLCNLLFQDINDGIKDVCQCLGK